MSNILIEVQYFFPQLEGRKFTSDILPLLRANLPANGTVAYKESKEDLRSKYSSGLRSATAEAEKM
jgi:hypothetical protein